jgi:hypothetical protein
MYAGIGATYLLSNTINYIIAKLLYDECKWWEFKKKSYYKLQMRLNYPLMKNEVKCIEQK